MLNAPVTVDEQQLWNAGQSWNFEQHWSFNGELLKVEIRRNSYNDQSWGRVNIWSPINRGWNHLCQMPIEHLDCSQISYVERDSAKIRRHLNRSCAQLLDRAAVILAAIPEYQVTL